jgi:hypothetical protein|tara:strand:+ start:3139 stop:5436 length:2298 start_codon:yes stop_codon:yes gene_type:complete
MYNSTKSKFPAQYVTESEKTDEWCESWINAIIGYMSYSDSPHKSSRVNDIQNYNIYNGEIELDDFKYITEQYGMSYPARLVNYPIISPKIDLLVGEDLRRPIDVKVSTTNKEAVLRKEDVKVSLIMKELTEEIHKDFFAQTGIEVPSVTDMELPEDIDVYMKYNYREMVEETAQDGLEYLIQKYNYVDLFKEGFRDLLVTGKEFFKIYDHNGDPFVRRVDPRSVIYETSTTSDYLDDSAWVGEERYLSYTEILDEFRDELTQEHMQELSAMYQIGSYDDLANYNSSFDWIDYQEGQEVKIRVVSIEWKSIKTLKFKVSENKYNPERPFMKQVSDDYKAKKKDNIKTKYVDDIWEATKIGGKIMVQARRRPNQIRSVDDAGTTQLSYVGCIRNNTTGRSVSMVDLLKNIQMLYNVVMYQIELALARSGGKAVVYDVSQLPTNLGMDMQSVLYHLKTDGIIPINSKDEGGQVNSFNQFSQVDFTLSQSVQQLINLKMMLEQTAGQISGVSPQREGAVGQYEYVGNVQRSVIQSATITESLFYSHAMVKKRIFERVANLMKVCWAGGKKASYILGDGAFKFLSVMPDVALQDYGIFIGDSGKDDALRQSLQQIAQSAVQGGQVTLLDVIKVFKADTFTEAEHILERAMDEMKANEAQQQEQQQAMMQAQAEQAQAAFEQQVQLEQVKNEAKIQVAQIQSETDLKIADMKSDDAREMSDVAHQVKNKQLFLNKRLEQEQKLEDKGQDAEANQPVTEDRKKQIQDIIKNS